MCQVVPFYQGRVTCLKVHTSKQQPKHIQFNSEVRFNMLNLLIKNMMIHTHIRPLLYLHNVSIRKQRLCFWIEGAQLYISLYQTINLFLRGTQALTNKWPKFNIIQIINSRKKYWKQTLALKTAYIRTAYTEDWYHVRPDVIVYMESWSTWLNTTYN